MVAGGHLRLTPARGGGRGRGRGRQGVDDVLIAIQVDGQTTGRGEECSGGGGQRSLLGGGGGGGGASGGGSGRSIVSTHRRRGGRGRIGRRGSGIGHGLRRRGSGVVVLRWMAVEVGGGAG